MLAGGGDAVVVCACPANCVGCVCVCRLTSSAGWWW